MFGCTGRKVKEGSGKLRAENEIQKEGLYQAIFGIES